MRPKREERGEVVVGSERDKGRFYQKQLPIEQNRRIVCGMQNSLPVWESGETDEFSFFFSSLKRGASPLQIRCEPRLIDVNTEIMVIFIEQIHRFAN